MKRLYKDAAAIETENGFGVMLDGRPVKLPGGAAFWLPTRALADAVAEEWRAQKAEILLHAMPLMQLAGTVLGAVSVNRAAIEDATLRYAETDLVCYRAGDPPSLARLQQSTWQPLLDWLSESTGVTLAVTTGFLPVRQTPEMIARLRELVRVMDDWTLGAFQAAASVSGSFVIALALTKRRIDSEQAFAAAELEEGYGIAKWGGDPAALKRRETVAADLAAARRFRDLLDSPHG